MKDSWIDKSEFDDLIAAFCAEAPPKRPQPTVVPRKLEPPRRVEAPLEDLFDDFQPASPGLAPHPSFHQHHQHYSGPAAFATTQPVEVRGARQTTAEGAGSAFGGLIDPAFAGQGAGVRIIDRRELTSRASGPGGGNFDSPFSLDEDDELEEGDEIVQLASEAEKALRALREARMRVDRGGLLGSGRAEMDATRERREREERLENRRDLESRLDELERVVTGKVKLNLPPREAEGGAGAEPRDDLAEGSVGGGEDATPVSRTKEVEPVPLPEENVEEEPALDGALEPPVAESEATAEPLPDPPTSGDDAADESSGEAAEVDPLPGVQIEEPAAGAAEMCNRLPAEASINPHLSQRKRLEHLFLLLGEFLGMREMMVVDSRGFPLFESGDGRIVSRSEIRIIQKLAEIYRSNKRLHEASLVKIEPDRWLCLVPSEDRGNGRFLLKGFLDTPLDLPEVYGVIDLFHDALSPGRV